MKYFTYCGSSGEAGCHVIVQATDKHDATRLVRSWLEKNNLMTYYESDGRLIDPKLIERKVTDGDILREVEELDIDTTESAIIYGEEHFYH